MDRDRVVLRWDSSRYRDRVRGGILDLERRGWALLLVLLSGLGVLIMKGGGYIDIRNEITASSLTLGIHHSVITWGDSHDPKD
jgi:hypothetical protein